MRLHPCRSSIDKLFVKYTLSPMGKMITTADAAERLGVTIVRVQTLCKQRRIPGARLIGGRTWLLPEDFKVTPGTRGPKLKGRK